MTVRTAATPAGHAKAWSALALAGLVVVLAAITVALAVVVRRDLLANGGETLLVTVPFAAVGVIVARRQPRNPMGWLLAGTSAIVLLSNDGSLYAVVTYRLGYHWPLRQLAAVLDASWEPALFALPLAILLFPDGRLPSARWRWVLRAYLTVSAAYLVVLCVVAVAAISGPATIDANGGLTAVDFPHGWLAVFQHAVFLAYVVFWLSFVLRQVQAWRSADGERRQQLKWLASGAVACMLAISYNVVAPAFDPTAPAVFQALGVVVGIFIAALPVCVGVGIVRYRLYDIDRIISRTLSYAIVTGLLVGVYAGLVLLATQVLTLTSQVAAAAATLAAAALFNPLRRRVQRQVDRQFNRARYDADRMLAAFAARLQDATDPDAVRSDLLGTVHQALEPVCMGVWLTDRAS